MHNRTTFLVGAKYLFWVFFLAVYTPFFVAAHARYTFGVSSADARYTRAQCETISWCGDNHDAFEVAQMTLMRAVAGEIWVSAIAVLLIDAIFLLIATRQLTGRRVSATKARSWWRAQLAVVVASLTIYLALLAIGARALHRIPENARLVPYQEAFSSPFADAEMIYYIAVFVAVNVISLVHNRALSRMLASGTQAVPAQRSA